MPFDPKEYSKKWYQEHKQEQKEYRERNKEKRKIYMKEWYQKHKNEIKEKASEKQRKLRLEVLTHYGGSPPKCSCCGETEISFLTIDHIHGNGTKHRRKLGGAARFYPWLKKNNFPEGYQVLCMNCNWSKRMNNGVCAHEQKEK